ncbi:MAG: hypothetical protein OXF88_05525, partial [Rhodobacteraceae bacterium]|nr:hypothetical protein [Paracoccaceae bacterium]
HLALSLRTAATAIANQFFCWTPAISLPCSNPELRLRESASRTRNSGHAISPGVGSGILAPLSISGLRRLQCIDALTREHIISSRRPWHGA